MVFVLYCWLVVSPMDQLEIAFLSVILFRSRMGIPKGEAFDERQSLLMSIDELREGRERIRCIDRVPEVRDEDRCSELDRHARRYGSQDDKHIPVAQIVVPHLIKVVPAR